MQQVVSPDDLRMIVSNIGVDPGFSAIYTTNSAMHTAFVQVNLKEGHKIGSYEYIDRMKARLRPRDAGTGDVLLLRQSGGRGAEHGHAAPIDVQVAGTDQKAGYQTALDMARKSGSIPDVADVYIPQDSIIRR